MRSRRDALCLAVRRRVVVLSVITATVATALVSAPASAAEPQADLSIFKTASPDPVTVGQDLTYTLQVTNSGPDTASTAVATDFLPAEVSFQSASPGCTNSAGTVTCALGSIASGAGATVQIVVRPNSSGVIGNTARVSSGTNDPDPGDNMSTRNVLVRQVGTQLTVRPLVLELLPSVDVRFGSAEARLTDAAGAPLAGQLIVFTSGSTELCRALTNGSGVARCQVRLLPEMVIAIVNLGYSARFDGTALYAPSREDGPLIRVTGVIDIF